MLLRLTFGLASTALVLVALPNCSDGGGGSGGGGACSQYYQALVAYYDRCEGGSATTQLANAQSRFEVLCGKWLAAPGTANLSNTVTTCTNNIASTACGEDVDCSESTGTLPDGTACGEDFQCTSGSCNKGEETACGKCLARIPIGGACKNNGANGCIKGARCVQADSDGGTCQAEKIAKAGEQCAGGEPVKCDKGLTCFFPTGAVGGTDLPKCRAPAAAGGDCGNSSDCTPNLSCTKGKCAQLAGVGEACDGFGDECAKNLACGSDKKCQTATRVAAGAECDKVRLCARGRCKGMTSTTDGETGDTVVKPGTCEDPLPDGAACTTDRTGDEDPQSCDVFAECINKVCTLPDPATCK